MKEKCCLLYAFTATIVFLINACVAVPTPQYENNDYPVFREIRPRSILVMPPINLSPDINAATTFLATSTVPLAEAGYYVIPVTLSSETFRQNGFTVAEEAWYIPFDRLYEIFGADAALYITVTRFGTIYVLLDSIVEAAASAKLIDLKTGLELWSGRASVSSGSSAGSTSLLEALIGAAISQMVNSLTDESFKAGRQANYEMLSAGRKDSILYGPYHPNWGIE